MKLTVDGVLFTYNDKKLKVLLIKRAFEPFMGQYALPGGFIQSNESTEQAVLRKIKEETNIDVNYLEQLYTFSNPNRDPRERIITVSYFGLINHDAVINSFKSNIHSTEIKFIDFDLINQMNIAFDHKQIIEYAKERLANKIQYEPIGFNLLNDEFTYPDVYELYCKLSNKNVDRGNLIKYLKKMNFIIPLNKTVIRNTYNRKANLFKFDENLYEKNKINGFKFFL